MLFNGLSEMNFTVERISTHMKQRADRQGPHLSCMASAKTCWTADGLHGVLNQSSCCHQAPSTCMSPVCAGQLMLMSARGCRFYPAWAFVLPTTVLRFAYSAIECTVFTCITYFVVGLAPAAGRCEMAACLSTRMLCDVSRACAYLVMAAWCQTPWHVRDPVIHSCHKLPLLPATHVWCHRWWRYLLLLFLMHNMSVTMFRAIGVRPAMQCCSCACAPTAA